MECLLSFFASEYWLGFQIPTTVWTILCQEYSYIATHRVMRAVYTRHSPSIFRSKAHQNRPDPLASMLGEGYKAPSDPSRTDMRILLEPKSQYRNKLVREPQARHRRRNIESKIGATTYLGDLSTSNLHLVLITPTLGRAVRSISLDLSIIRSPYPTRPDALFHQLPYMSRALLRQLPCPKYICNIKPT